MKINWQHETRASHDVASSSKGRRDLLSNERTKVGKGTGGGREVGGVDTALESQSVYFHSTVVRHMRYTSLPNNPAPPTPPHGIGRLFGQSIKQVAEIPLTPLSLYPPVRPWLTGKKYVSSGWKALKLINSIKCEHRQLWNKWIPCSRVLVVEVYARLVKHPVEID